MSSMPSANPAMPAKTRAQPGRSESATSETIDVHAAISKQAMASPMILALHQPEAAS
jgi:hypothetical protein